MTQLKVIDNRMANFSMYFTVKGFDGNPICALFDKAIYCIDLQDSQHPIGMSNNNNSRQNESIHTFFEHSGSNYHSVTKSKILGCSRIIEDKCNLDEIDFKQGGKVDLLIYINAFELFPHSFYFSSFY